MTPDQLKKLNNLEDFRCFLDMIHDEREATIASLEKCCTEELHQKAGAISAYQRLLETASYTQMRQPAPRHP